jgi:UDP-N-acetylmuramoylalanine--D-glutamate ligase
VDGQMLTVVRSEEELIQIDLGKGTWSRGVNRANAAAAAVAAACAGATREGVQTVINRMAGLPHRISPVAVIAGVSYVDDSKATNPGAVQGALETFSGNVILILGGRSKGENYRSLRPVVRKKAKGLVLMGECRERMRAALEGACTGPVVMTASMDAAVGAARQMATAGDVVLLSPACASFDMFDGYAHRGRCFQAAVQKLKGHG